MAASFEQAKQEWKRHACESESGICDCLFVFHCEGCAEVQTVLGESMDAFIGTRGLCEACFYGVNRIDDEPQTTNDAEDRYNRGGW